MPIITMKPQVWDLLWAYTEYQVGEVACFGYSTIEDGHVHVDEVFLVPQESDASQVDFITTGLPYALEKAVADGRLDDLNFCWHSHGTYGTTFSSTDDDMVKKMGLTAPLFVSCIFNKEGKSNARIDVFEVPKMGRTQVTFKDVPVYRERTVAEEEQILADLERFVKKPAPKPKHTGQTNLGQQKQLPKGHSYKLQPKQVMSNSALERAATEMIQDNSPLTIEEIAEELEWFPIVEGDIKFWVSVKTGMVEHYEDLSDKTKKDDAEWDRLDEEESAWQQALSSMTDEEIIELNQQIAAAVNEGAL